MNAGSNSVNRSGRWQRQVPATGFQFVLCGLCLRLAYIGDVFSFMYFYVFM
jgi:hypothetical protein